MPDPLQTNGPLSFRRFTKADSNTVWWLHEESLRASGLVPLPREKNTDLDDIERVYLTPGGEFLLMEDAARVLGMAALRRLSPDVAELKRMRIHPALLRQGLGSHLLAHMLQVAISMGFQELVLDTLKEQIAAQKLYEKFGFHKFQESRAGDFHIYHYRLVLAAAR